MVIVVQVIHFECTLGWAEKNKFSNFTLRVNLGEDYAKHEPGQITESDQIGWGGVPPRGDT